MPVEDLGFVVLEHPMITFTQGVIALLAENNVAVVFCGENFLPCSMLLHLDGHQVQNERFRFQLDATEPLKKQLWKQTVKAKISNQARVLESICKSGEALRYKATQVQSGDVTNEEAQAARKYWPALFGKQFTRERFGAAPNPALNYGYTVLRAAVARALTGSGLLPTLGIHHHNRYNAFCLADDVMEPYRPYVDRLVLGMLEEKMDCEQLDTQQKAALLQVLTTDVRIHQRQRPLMVGLSETTASLARCFAGEGKNIRYPVLE